MQHALQLPEIVELVCRHVYLDSRECILDPPLLHGTPRALGVSTLLALCSVNRLFYREATPYLYRHVSINLPASFEAIVGGVGVLEEEAATPRQSLVSKPGSTLTNVSLVDDRPGRSLHGQGHATLTPNVLGPHEIESPPASREPSLDRGRGMSANFFQRTSVTEASTVSAMTQYAQPWRPDNPGLNTRCLTFERFRSHGMQRTQREGSRQRFVTQERLLQILRGTRHPGNLSEVDEGCEDVSSPESCEEAPPGTLDAFGATEYIDSALGLAVLEELLLRGGTATREQPADCSGSELALRTQPLQAIDLCGCVSRTFVESLYELVVKYNLDARETTRPAIVFPHLQRLGLVNVLVTSQLLTAFVNSFPNLTHLDLTNTRTTPALLASVGESRSLRLQALSLSKCQQLDSEALRAFFVDSASNVLADLVELNLHFDATSAMPLTRAHLRDILTSAPAFQSGKLRFLDLSTAPLDDELLIDCFAAQPELLDLGLSNCPSISWRALQRFIEGKAYNVEILELRHSCRQPLLSLPVSVARPARRNDALLNTIMGLHQYLINRPGQPATNRLRVIEVEEKVLESIEQSSAHPDWRVFYGKSWRGWYVNCGVTVETTDDGKRVSTRLDTDDPRRLRMVRIAARSKAGGYNLGWHARKMTVLRPDGMLGREHGLYNFHAFS